MPHLYENDTPIDMPEIVLDLLDKRWGDWTSRHISLWPHSPPHVEIGHHHDFSDSTYHRFLVTDRVVKQCVDSGYVEGKKCWGYTEMRELHLSGFGQEILENTRKWLCLNKEETHAEYWLERRRWEGMPK